MIRVRRAAIGFALFSAIYWHVVSWLVGLLHPLTGIDEVPFWLVASIDAGTAALYAAITLIFCHRLARRAARQALDKFENRDRT